MTTPVELAANLRTRLATTRTDLQAELAALQDPDGADLGRAADLRVSIQKWDALDLGLPEPRVYGALDLAGAVENLKAPCLAAVGLGEDIDADLAPSGTETVQQVRTGLAVVYVLPARNDPGGVKAAATGDGPLKRAMDAVRGRVVGWTPARHWEPLAVRRSRLLGLENGRVVWQDEYTTFGWAVQARS